MNLPLDLPELAWLCDRIREERPLDLNRLLRDMTATAARYRAAGLTDAEIEHYAYSGYSNLAGWRRWHGRTAA